MRVFDLIYRVRTLRIPITWLIAVLGATLGAWVCSGCRLEYRMSTDATYTAVQVGPPAGPLDPEPAENPRPGSATP